MIVYTQVDLSECEKYPDRPDNMRALIFSGENDDLDGALAALAKCRLVREGHCYTTEIMHSVSGFAAASLARPGEWIMDEHGEITQRA